MKKIVIYGAGGLGREVAQLIENINKEKPVYEIVGFVSEGDNFYEGQLINNYPWLGDESWLYKHKDDVVCTVAIGNAGAKAKIQKRLLENGIKIETLIAPDAMIGTNTIIGTGCIICIKTAVSVNCEIGDGVLLNGNIMIGHDTRIGDYTTIMTSTDIGGYCEIGSEVNIGGHVFIVPHRKIGSNATIAAGSIVFTNVKKGTTVLGNPAKRMKAIEN